MKQVSFIHAADLHLDSPFQGLASAPEHIFQDIQMSTFKALDELVQTAIEKRVDFILLVGDLFDNDQQSLKAQARLRKAFETLADANISVYLSYGNHDHIHGNAHAMPYPQNVFIFPNEQVSEFTYTKDDQKLAQIYGFSYEQRAITENKAKEYHIQDPSTPFHIAALHGSLASNEEHDIYAPFRIQDLLEEKFDYWALGHIHQRTILKENPPVVYPGNTQGRHRNETGEKGCYYVTLTETKQELSFIPLQSILFENLSINISDCTDMYEVKEKIEQIIITQYSGTRTLIDLHISGYEHLFSLNERALLEDIVDLIHETTTITSHWQFTFSISIDEKSPPELHTGAHFIGHLAEQFQDVDVQSLTSDLYNHPQGRKHLAALSLEDKQQITTEAKQLLFNLLNKD